jgi:hypothetical protein
MTIPADVPPYPEALPEPTRRRSRRLLRGGLMAHRSLAIGLRITYDAVLNAQ